MTRLGYRPVLLDISQSVISLSTLRETESTKFVAGDNDETEMAVTSPFLFLPGVKVLSLSFAFP
jgi:hypothetical protein